MIPTHPLANIPTQNQVAIATGTMGRVFFTKNGRFLGFAFDNVPLSQVRVHCLDACFVRMLCRTWCWSFFVFGLARPVPGKP